MFISKNKEIERINLNFCKKLLFVKQSTSSVALYGELKRYPLFINRYVRIVKCWFKVVNSETIIIQRLYKSLLDDFEEGKRNWAFHIKCLLDSYGFSDMWLHPEYIDVNCFVSMFKQRLIDNFLQYWHVALENSSCLCLHKQFKKNIFI